MGLFGLFVCLLWFSAAFASGSKAEVWRIVSVTGEATLKTANAVAKSVKPNDRVNPGDQLDAGPSSQVVLARGETSIAMTSGSQMVVPEKAGAGERATIMQKLGTLLFKIEKKSTPHFEVQTPFMAAVVKGTTFTVSVDGAASAVHVIEGAVEVASLATGDVAMVRPGFTAVVSSKPGSGVTIKGGRKGTPSQKQTKRETKGKADKSGGPAKGSAANKDVAMKLAKKASAETKKESRADKKATAGNARLRVMMGTPVVNVADATNGFVKDANFRGNKGKASKLAGRNGASGQVSASGNGNRNGNGNGNSGGVSGNGNSGRRQREPGRR